MENRIFHLIAEQKDGISIEHIVARLFNITSGPRATLRRVVERLIRDDERFIFGKNDTLTLTAAGRRFKNLMNGLFVVVDLETTGTRTYRDKITEISAIKIRGGAMGERFESLVNPGRYIPFDITRITGITNDMVQNSPTAEELMPQFVAFLGDAVFVAHNASFDYRFIAAALDETGCGQFTNSVLCTCKMSRKMFPECRRHDLDSISRYLGVVNKSRHRAGGDAAACAEVFIAMLYNLPVNSVFSLDELLVYA